METVIAKLQETKKASFVINTLAHSKRISLLEKISKLLLEKADVIIGENQKDLEKMDDLDPKKDRLLLSKERLEDISKSVLEVSNLPDPTGITQLEKTLSNGLKLSKISVPLGVVGVIFESRPNVTIDVAILGLFAGSAVVLRGGSDAQHSNMVLVKEVLHPALEELGLPKEAIYLMPTQREHVKTLLEAQQYIDILIPRGSQSLIDFVKENAKVPTIETGAGVCHTYVEKTADLQMAAEIVVNAKTQRPSVCNSLDTILVDKEVAKDFIEKVIVGFLPFEVEIFADKTCFDILSGLGYPFLSLACAEDFGREFLSQKCSMAAIDSFHQALEHISKHSSKHSEAIVTKDSQLAESFLSLVDAAAVYHNASTRFTDGNEFGLGAEIGISTQKLHARGPFALEKLTTEKWIVRGEGQIR
ncbi:MAG: glutamate-5-semialdehyde dehydrogenase [Flavobacteriaceae bacterium]|nr:MAG: glutamate-5-semialdehyde dehydrogenase [Flavobacteriaceae bacterium]